MSTIAPELQIVRAPQVSLARDTARQATAAAANGKENATPPGWDEAWRHIYTPLLMQTGSTRPQILAVSSAHDGEGKTTVALGLALTIANDLNANVLLIDCNLFNPSLSDTLGFEDEVGLANWLGLSNWLPGEVSVEAVTLPTSIHNLWVIPSGPRVANPSRLIRSTSMVDLVYEARTRHDIVIIDAPALLSSSDARVLLSYSDAVLLVVRAGKSTTNSLSRAIGMVEGVANRGIVVNDFQSSIPRALRRFFISS